MKNYFSALLVLFFGLNLFADSTLVQADFSDGTTNGWINGAVGASLTVENDAGIGSGNALRLSGASGNNAYIEKLFSEEITLGVNDYIEVSLDYRFNSTPPDANNSMFFGFVNDSTQTGLGDYVAASVNLGAGGPSGNNSKFSHTDDTNEGKYQTIDSATTDHNLVFTATVVPGGFIEFSLQIDGTTIDETSTGNTVLSSTTFDALRLGGSGLGTETLDIFYDNITVTTSIQLAGPADLIYSNVAPGGFQLEPQVATNLALGIQNKGFDATNVTATLTANNPLFTVNTAAVATPLIVENGLATNLFSVTVSSNAPVGVYPDAFTLQMEGTGTDGSVNTSEADIAVTVLSTVSATLEKTEFAANQTGSDTALLTVSNNAVWALSYQVSVNEPWLSVPTTGTLTLAAGTSTGITVTADASVTPAQGQYTDTLSVTYLNNTSLPNPANFPIVFDVGPKIEPLAGQAVITESGGINRLPGQYEPGEQLQITIVSTNNGAIPVSNIVHTLSGGTYFTVSAISNAANYGVMPVGSSTATTYQVDIDLSAPEGTYTLTAGNSADGSSWANPLDLDVVSHPVPVLFTDTVSIVTAEGLIRQTALVVSNSGNAALNFTITDDAAWDTRYTVNGPASPSEALSGGTELPLNDPAPDNPFMNADGFGQSDTADIGFSFPFYGTGYTKFYIDSNGAIILSPTGITDNLEVSDGSTGDLPLGNRPLIAPFRHKQLLIPDNSPVRYMHRTDPERLVIIHEGVTLGTLSPGTNLHVQTELFADGRIKFSYLNINGSQLDEVAVGIQNSGTRFTNAAALPATGTALEITPTENRWVRYAPASGTVSPFDSAPITFTADGTGQSDGTTNQFTALFNWGAAGSTGVTVSASVEPAVPMLGVSSSLYFSAQAGTAASRTLTLTNTGTADLNFIITDTGSEAVAYSRTLQTGAGALWEDLSADGTEIPMLDPHANAYITASNEGYSALQPIGFRFPFYGIVFTQFSAGVNGGLSLGTAARISAGSDFSTGRADVPLKFIAPYWGDLHLDAGASVRYRSTSDRLVVSWENVEQNGLTPGTDLDFQLTLYPNGDIRFVYRDVNGSRWPLTQAGIRTDTDRFTGDTLVLNQDKLITTNLYGYTRTNYVSSIAGRAVMLSVTNTPMITYHPATGTIPVDGTKTVTLTGDAAAFTPGGPNSITNTTQLQIAYEAATNTVTNTVDVTFAVTNSTESVAPGDPLSEPLDEDLDGMTYDEELIAGTDPLDGTSVFSVSTDAGRLIRWPTAPGRTYTVWYTFSLTQPFLPLKGAEGLESGSFIDTVNTNAPAIYYRITID